MTKVFNKYFPSGISEKKIFKLLNYGLYSKNLPRKKKKIAKGKARKWCIDTYILVFCNEEF